MPNVFLLLLKFISHTLQIKLLNIMLFLSHVSCPKLLLSQMSLFKNSGWRCFQTRIYPCYRTKSHRYILVFCRPIFRIKSNIAYCEHISPFKNYNT